MMLDYLLEERATAEKGLVSATFVMDFTSSTGMFKKSIAT